MLLNFTTLDSKNLFFRELEEDDNDIITSRCRYNDNGKNVRMIIQSPKMLLEDKSSIQGDNFYIKFKFDVSDESKMDKLGCFYNFLYNIDEQCIRHITNTSNEWGSESKTREEVQYNYISLLNIPDKWGFPPSLNFNIGVKNDDLNCDLFDINGRSIDIDNINLGDRCVVIMEMEGVNIKLDNYRPRWIIRQIITCEQIERKCLFSAEDTEIDNGDIEADNLDAESEFLNKID